MKKQYFHMFCLLFSATLFNNLNGQSHEVLTKNDSLQIEMLIAIQKTYLDAHIPDPSKFDAFLKRDLNSYFSIKFGKIDVKMGILTRCTDSKWCVLS
jgi:hypothetical protein